MALADDLKAQVAQIFKDQWTTRKGQVVPEPDALQLGNDAVEFERATILYADLSGSTSLVNDYTWTFSAEIYKTYLYCAARIVRAEGGAITSYDGDRIMGVFVGDLQSTRAMRCALKINYAVQFIVNPALKARYQKTAFEVRQVVGIDTSPIRAARTGVRGGNDLVWVGRAANIAAKLTEIKAAERTWITKAVFDYGNDAVKLGGADQRPMWTQYAWTERDNAPVYGFTWWWRV
jgi:class 3 adenylate cyclase